MNIQELHKIFQSTVQPDQNIRSNAEQVLKSNESQTGFLSSLLQLATVNDAVAQAAAIYFKNRLRGWGDLPIQDKEFVKANIFEAISHATTTRTILLASVGVVITHETRDSMSWPELLPQVVQLLHSSDLNILFTGLTVLLEIIKSWMWYPSEKRASLNSVIESVFPLLLQIGAKVERSNTSLEALFLLKCIVKTFNYSIKMDLSRDLIEVSKIAAWSSLFISIIEWKWTKSTSISLPDDDENREKHMFWKCKKWAYASMNCLMGRYAIARKKDSKYSGFSKKFLRDFAPKVLTIVLQQINMTIQGEWTSQRVKHSQFCFLEYCIKANSTWVIIQAHLEPIVLQFIFPQLCFTLQDMQLWEDDPVEYVQKKINSPLEDFKSPVSAAADMLDALIRVKTSQTLLPVLKMIDNIATSTPTLEPSKKYGILSMMCVFAQNISQEPAISSQMESFLVSQVYPELASPHCFLRAKACDVMSEYAQIEFKDAHNLQIAFGSIIRMINDSDLPARVSSALAFGPFLKYPELSTALRPHVVRVMQSLLQITNEIDLDTLSSSMELLVFEFADELRPFATQLAAQLCESFMRIMNENNFSSEDVDFDKIEEKTMAAMGILKTLDALILSVEASPDIVLKLEVIIVPIVVFILDSAILDLYEEVFEIIGTLLFCVKQVSPNMWTVFPLIYNTFKMDAFEYLAEMLPSLDNYIAYGKEVFLHDAEKQSQLMDIIFTVMRKESRESDKIRGIQLIESLMLNLKGLIDALIPRFIEIAYNALSSKIKTTPFRVHCIEIVVNAIYYNADLTIRIMEEINWTGPFFELWFKNLSSMSRVHDKKLSILTICLLLEFPQSSLPQSIAQMWPHLFDGLLMLFGTYQKALAERNLIDSADYDDEKDYADYDENGLLDDDNDSEFVDEDETVDSLAQAASEYACDEEEEDESDEWDVEEFLQEDISFMTILNRVDAYETLQRTMSHLVSTGQASFLEGRLSIDQKQLLQTCLERSE